MWEEVVEKAVDVKTKTSLQPLSRTREINFKYPKNYKPLARKTTTRPIESIGIKTKSSLIISLLLIQVSLKPKLPIKTSVIKKTVEEIILLLGLTLIRLQKRTKTKTRRI